MTLGRTIASLQKDRRIDVRKEPSRHTHKKFSRHLQQLVGNSPFWNFRKLFLFVRRGCKNEFMGRQERSIETFVVKEIVVFVGVIQ